MKRPALDHNTGQSALGKEGNDSSTHDHNQQDDQIEAEKYAMTSNTGNQAEKFQMDQQVGEKETQDQRQKEQIAFFAMAHQRHADAGGKRR